MILSFNKNRPAIHQSAFIAPTADLIGRVKIGRDASIWHGAVLRGDINRVEVGARSNIQDNSVLHVEKSLACIVKDSVTVGHSANVHGCVVEDFALIGIGAIILNGAVIGASSIIGAGAVVLEGVKIPPRSLVVGTPGKVVRRLGPADLKHLRQSAANYVKLAQVYKKEENLLIHPSDMKFVTDLNAIF
ncbi:MAG: gamma carbonic anhydrase family protein [Candidatus Omnitrophica bacterium]|jgi:carbonic anhydrase/acetyltransferase-like protein (isoleucine patch superfamily)|nr:gamma carbonic anhydrase family protein [Candidatus Omnitrophota bacterium]